MRPATLKQSAKGATDWVPLNYLCDTRKSIDVALGGASLTYSIEYTLVDVLRGVQPTSDQVHELISGTAAAVASFDFPVTAVRLNVTAYTSGTATATILQAG